MFFNKSTPFLAIIACILWSTAFAGIKVGLQYTSPMQFAGIRFILSGLLIMPFAGNIGEYFRSVFRNAKSILIVSLFQTVILYALFYFAISRIPGYLTAIIIGASPLFAALVSHFFSTHDKINAKKSWSILVGLSGVILLSVSRFSIDLKKSFDFVGILLLMLGNISSGYANVYVSKNKDKISPLVMNSAQIMLGGFALLFLSLFFEKPDFSLKPLEYYLSLGWLSFISAVSFSIWFVLLKRPGVLVSELNIWKFIIPLLGAILSWLILEGEKPTGDSIVGMILISFSLVILNLPKKKSS